MQSTTNLSKHVLIKLNLLSYQKNVRLSLYNDDTGIRQEVTLPKSKIAIVENPLYAVINEPNSTMQRLIRKLSLMDTADEELTAGNLDLIIQLPYAIKTLLQVFFLFYS